MAGDLSINAYETVNECDNIREDIMSQIKDSLLPGGQSGGADDLTVSVQLPGMTDAIDVGTGAGALVMDDCMQRLANITQTAAQLVANKNRATKEVTQRLG